MAVLLGFRQFPNLDLDVGEVAVGLRFGSYLAELGKRLVEASLLGQCQSEVVPRVLVARVFAQ